MYWGWRRRTVGRCARFFPPPTPFCRGDLFKTVSDVLGGRTPVSLSPTHRLPNYSRGETLRHQQDDIEPTGAGKPHAINFTSENHCLLFLEMRLLDLYELTTSVVSASFRKHSARTRPTKSKTNVCPRDDITVTQRAFNVFTLRGIRTEKAVFSRGCEIRVGAAITGRSLSVQ